MSALGDSALGDVKVLDLTRLLPGGFCSLLLADLGADVLKVEDTAMGDYVRWAPPYYGDEEQGELGTRSALYLALNRGKRSIRLDLKSVDGREALLRLVEAYDVVLDGFRPGVLERLGVGYEVMRERNPGIVYCAITGYGQTGPNTQRSGHDMNYLGLIGLLGLTGEPGGRPIQSAGQIADLGGGGLMAAFGVLAALHERRRSGEGQIVDVSMADGALSWLAMVAAQYLCDGAAAGARRGPAQRRHRSVTTPTRRPTAGSPAARWSRSSGPRSAMASAGPDLVERQFEAPGSDGLARRSPRSSAPAPGRSGAPSTTSTTAASSRCSTSTRRSTRSWSASARWWSSSSSRRSARSACSARRSSSGAPRPTRAARLRHSASTPTRSCARRATAKRRSRR